jgi:hypothetical protein
VAPGAAGGATTVAYAGTDDGGVLPTLCHALEVRGAELNDKPREHNAVALLGQVEAYLGSWYAPCADVTRRFAAMTSAAADALEKQAAALLAMPRTNQDTLAATRAAQTKLRMIALLCYGGSWTLTQEDAEQLAALMLQVTHGYTSTMQDHLEDAGLGPSKDTKQSADGVAGAPEEVRQQQWEAADLRAMRARCRSVAAARISAVVSALAGQHASLTAATASVMAHVAHLDPALQWQHLPAAGLAAPSRCWPHPGEALQLRSGGPCSSTASRHAASSTGSRWQQQ